MENNQLKRILLIDDDIYIIRLLTLLLEKSDYEIISAGNGKDAMRILAEQTVDMIVLDLMMPEMDGLVFLRWLRQDAKATMPTLVLTGLATGNIEKQALSAGATDLLYKPIKINDLLSKIRQLEESISDK